MSEKWALITGSNRGIGEKTLCKFAQNGYNIYAHARKEDADTQERWKSFEEEFGVVIEPVYFDLTDTEQMTAVLKDMQKRKCRIDVLVNNAGIMHAGLFQLTDTETIRNVMNVNFFSVIELTRLVSKMMIRKKSGSIVNVASITGMDLGIGQCAYGVSKAAVIAFTKTIAAEFGNYGIRVNAVAPGIVNTRMAEAKESVDAISKLENGKGKLSRLAEPEEIANAIYFLASEDAAFINGQVMRVDGGNHLLD